MPGLHIKELPEDLYEALARSALMDSRSIVQQAAALLRSALDMREEMAGRRKSVLKEVEGLQIKNAGKLPDPANLIREDRER